MEIIKNFGLDPLLLGAQIINFLIIFYLLRRLLYKPILNLLKNREATIKEGLKKAEEARKLMEKTLEEEKATLKKAQKEASKLVEEAKNQALENAKQSEEYAKKQAEKIISQAKEQIGKETKDAQQKLATYVSNLAMQFLQKGVREFFDEKEQDEILTKAIKKLKEKPNWYDKKTIKPTSIIQLR